VSALDAAACTTFAVEMHFSHRLEIYSVVKRGSHTYKSAFYTHKDLLQKYMTNLAKCISRLAKAQYLFFSYTVA
jgi:hypothetical protein